MFSIPNLLATRTFFCLTQREKLQVTKNSIGQKIEIFFLDQISLITKHKIDRELVLISHQPKKKRFLMVENKNELFSSIQKVVYISPWLSARHGIRAYQNQGNSVIIKNGRLLHPQLSMDMRKIIQNIYIFAVQKNSN